MSFSIVAISSFSLSIPETYLTLSQLPPHILISIAECFKNNLEGSPLSPTPCQISFSWKNKNTTEPVANAFNRPIKIRWRLRAVRSSNPNLLWCVYVICVCCSFPASFLFGKWFYRILNYIFFSLLRRFFPSFGRKENSMEHWVTDFGKERSTVIDGNIKERKSLCFCACFQVSHAVWVVWWWIWRQDGEVGGNSS